VSANVGDQFGSANQHLLPRVFTWFYFAINIGLESPSHAGVARTQRLSLAWMPGIFTLSPRSSSLGRRKFVHIPPAGLPYLGEALKREPYALGNLLILVFAAMFWALWNQNFSARLCRRSRWTAACSGANEPVQIQTANPCCARDVAAYLIYPTLERFVKRRPCAGSSLWAVIAAFVVVGSIQMRIDAGERPHRWHRSPRLPHRGRVLVSVTHLEFSHTQAPRKMKSLVMCLYLASISLGNVFTTIVNVFIQNPDGTVKLAGASYYWFFVKIMTLTAVLFLVVARFYRGRTYIQEEAEPPAA
jgi:POT family proton-dependent oligopeptide transporter